MTNPNDPAYPRSYRKFDQQGQNIEVFASDGLTKREYFAVMAMQGLIMIERDYFPTPEHVAENATKFSDALIAELNKEIK